MSKKAILLVGLLPAALMIGQPQTARGVTVTANLPSPQPVGTVVTWTAVGTVANSSYKFIIISGSQQRVVQDFSPFNTLSWTTLQEGGYEVVVSVSAPATGKYAQKKT